VPFASTPGHPFQCAADRASRARLSRGLTDLRSTPHRRRGRPLLAEPHVPINEQLGVLGQIVVRVDRRGAAPCACGAGTAPWLATGGICRHREAARPAEGRAERGRGKGFSTSPSLRPQAASYLALWSFDPRHYPGPVQSRNRLQLISHWLVPVWENAGPRQGWSRGAVSGHGVSGGGDLAGANRRRTCSLLASKR